MTNPSGHSNAQNAALAALRQWSSVTRADLVAAAWHAGNRNVTELAAAARVGRQAIYQDLRRNNINPPADREEPAFMHPNLIPRPNLSPAAATDYPPPGWRHPNLTAVRRLIGAYGTETFCYTIAPMTGDEPMPELPAEWKDKTDSEPGWEGHNARQREIGWVRRVWARALFLRLFKALYFPSGSHTSYQEQELLAGFMRQRPRYERWDAFSHPVGLTGTAGEVWRQYAQARDTLAAAYQAMKTRPDNEWRAGIGQIVDATGPAEAAARRWDYVAAAFVQAADWFGSYLCPESPSSIEDSLSPIEAIRYAAAELDLEVAGWTLDPDPRAYHGDRWGRWGTRPGTAQQHIADIIEAGREWLGKVDRLAGDR